MGNRIKKTEMIRLRNAGAEIEHRLNRLENIIFLIPLLTLRNYQGEDALLCGYIEEMFSYLSDDIHYIKEELKKGLLLSRDEWDKKIFNSRR
ncbi:hypothetical protein J4486_002655 [Salmonella enterica]|nr:hypothetical protein [Salmonella enterica]